MQEADAGPPAPSAPPDRATAAAGMKGKHRLLAELKRLEQETRSLEDDLEELGRTENVSATLQGFLNIVERIPDPLLPETIGPAEPLWDRWFEGSQDLHGGSRCWIL